MNSVDSWRESVYHRLNPFFTIADRELGAAHVEASDPSLTRLRLE